MFDWLTKRRISAIANIPIITGIMSIPPERSTEPKVKRGAAAGFSMPMSRRAGRAAATHGLDLRAGRDEHRAGETEQTSQKYSNELNWIATSASSGAEVISTIVPKRPPIAENTTPAPSASCPWPLRVIA